MKTILGAGLAGLSCSYHLGHEQCIIFEKNSYAGGHVHSNHVDGFVWDEGIHISFTKHDYVRDLFAKSVDYEFLEFEVNVANYYKGDWIPHPAQSNLYAVQEPQRTECLRSFLEVRSGDKTFDDNQTKNYAEWLTCAFGRVFSEIFPTPYTRKYWTCNPEQLSTDWLGKRVFLPDLNTVRRGYEKAPDKSTHYITTVRYPRKGGYERFAASLAANANIKHDHCVESIDLHNRQITFTNGTRHHYDELINTLPLPEFISFAGPNVPLEVREAAKSLTCTSLLLVNVTANRKVNNPYHYYYVYDEDKYATRITHVDMLSSSNAPENKTGIQVEVYESQYKPFNLSHADIALAVVQELKDMGIIDFAESVDTHYVPFANVVFDIQRREAQSLILTWLEDFGLVREKDDLDPMTDWDTEMDVTRGKLILAGRFGQWKYFWTDDCVLRGLQIGGTKTSSKYG